MKKLHFTITIDAPREHVWDVMLTNPTYEEWTNVFDANSTYEGSWEQGSEIKFLSKTEDGSVAGMIAEIAENRRPEFMSIHHLAMVEKGVES